MTTDRQFDWLLHDLAIGAASPQTVGAALVRRHNIGAVIDVRLEDRDPEEELAACGVWFLHLPTEDRGAVSQPMLDDAVAFAGRSAAQQRKLLIHCQHGIGRAPLVGLCVLADRGHAPLAALALAKEAREQVSPSPGQYAAWSSWLRRRQPAHEVPSFDAFAAIAYRHLSARS